MRDRLETCFWFLLCVWILVGIVNSLRGKRYQLAGPVAVFLVDPPEETLARESAEALRRAINQDGKDSIGE
jgi:hypothetical protein